MAYIGNGPGVASQRILTTLTAVDGQTTFVPSAGYTLGYVDVFLNGVKLVDGTDYTAANGVNIVLTEAAALNDTVEVVTYFPRGLSDGYTKAEADGRYEPIDSAYTKSESDARYMDINAVTLPDQTGHTGQFLQSDGTNADWATVDLTQFDAPVQFKNYTTTQRNALTGLAAGDTIFNSTTGSIEFYDGANWVATNLIPTVNSVSGDIYSGAPSSLSLNMTNATEIITVRFSEAGVVLAEVSDVTVTSGSASVSVPSVVYGQSTGDTIAISILNQDGTPSSNAVSKTVIGVPTGGTRTVVGNYVVHRFTSSGTFVVPSGFSASVSYIVVAGGGGGGAGNTASALGGGGGGGGGYVSGSTTVNPGNYTITIGAGGGGDATITSTGTTSNAADGGNSSCFGATAIGGGGGGSRNANETGNSGGSGGGACGNGSNSGGSGTTGQGNDGGSKLGSTNSWSACGGGGYSAAAADAGSGSTDDDTNTAGGAGTTVGWLSSGVVVAGGGGGGGNNGVVPSAGVAGAGGTGNASGGDGGTKNVDATGGDAPANCGGGGGGSACLSGNSVQPTRGGNGGGGTVFVRYTLV